MSADFIHWLKTLVLIVATSTAISIASTLILYYYFRSTNTDSTGIGLALAGVTGYLVGMLIGLLGWPIGIFASQKFVLPAKGNQSIAHPRLNTALAAILALPIYALVSYSTLINLPH